MPRSPKVLSRQHRRQSRTKDREERRVARQPASPQFMNEHTYPKQKGNHQPVVPLTDKQADYGDAIEASRITFGIGPAGTGKTYFAAMKAAEALHNKEIKKIYLTRPAVEAGETLGFLPGDLNEKYEPYLRPFKDALNEFFGAGHVEYLIENKIIEAVPLNYLRGATFKNCWVLLDEAQNTTPLQMKMFLTRIGDGSKLIINGDLKQKDISGPSGLADALERFEGKPEIEAVRFGREDIVRSGICRMIVEGYED